MATIYSEGPFRNWTAVSFGGVEMTVVFSLPDFILPNISIAGETGAATGDTNAEKVAPYRKLWTGETSGATVNATSIPILQDPTPTNGLVWFDEDALATNTANILIADEDSAFPFVTGETCT